MTGVFPVCYAVIAEELDELWDEVKADRGREFSGLEEAIQVSAMGLRYVLDMARQASARSTKNEREAITA